MVPVPQALSMVKPLSPLSKSSAKITPLSTVPRTAALSPDAAKRRVVREGLLFRVREILEGVFPSSAPRAVLLSGGLTRDPFLTEGLASCLGRPIEVLEEPESTLLGVARLTAGLETRRSRARVVSPGRGGSYLAAKFEEWRSWLRNVVGE